MLRRNHQIHAHILARKIEDRWQPRLLHQLHVATVRYHDPGHFYPYMVWEVCEGVAVFAALQVAGGFQWLAGGTHGFRLLQQTANMGTVSARCNPSLQAILLCSTAS
jgi:hypothetical protein